MCCARCGESSGHLERVCRRGVAAYYCHDKTADVDCYLLSMWAGFPELKEFT
jgi:hypothetical protein